MEFTQELLKNYIKNLELLTLKCFVMDGLTHLIIFYNLPKIFF